jgi:hypothetical protein
MRTRYRAKANVLFRGICETHGVTPGNIAILHFFMLDVGQRNRPWLPVSN